MFFLDLIGEKRNGIFALLNNESKLPSPSVTNFTSNVHNLWSSTTVLSTPRHEMLKGFSIRHFAGDVFYDTVNEPK